MYKPHIPEALEMYERMTKLHADELYRSRLLWKEYKNADGTIVQLVPIADLLFKF